MITEPIAARLDQFESRLADMRAKLGQLTEQLERGPAVVDRTMRSRLTCPACACRRLLHATEVLDRAEAFARAKMSLVQPGMWNLAGVGQFEAWLCTECGLVEWYVPDLSAVEIDGTARRLVDGGDR